MSHYEYERCNAGGLRVFTKVIDRTVLVSYRNAEQKRRVSTKQEAMLIPRRLVYRGRNINVAAYRNSNRGFIPDVVGIFVAF